MSGHHRSIAIAAALPLTLLVVLLGSAVGRFPRTPEAVAASPADAEVQAFRITYPQDGTLFPPEIVAPTFLWTGGPESDSQWSITVLDDAGDEIVSASSGEPRWRPSEEDWKTIKERSLERDAEVTVSAASGTSAAVKIRTSKDAVGDSLFYREVPLPFLKAVQDPSKIRWRFGTIDLEDGPPIVLQDLPVCGNCHSFADDGSVLGLDVDYGNDKGGYGILPVSSHMVMDDETIISWADYKKTDGEVTFGLLSRVSPTGRYVVSTVKDRSVFVALDDLIQRSVRLPRLSFSGSVGESGSATTRINNLINNAPCLQYSSACPPAGRQRKDIDVICATLVVTADDEETFERSRDAARKQLAFYGSTPAYRPTLDCHGWGDLHLELNRLSKRGRWDEMAGLVPDAVLESIAVVGPRSEIAARLEARLAGIADGVSLTHNRFPDPGHWVDTVRALKGL